MVELLWEAVVPELLVDRVRLADSLVGLPDGVVVADGRVRLQGASLKKVRVGNALRAVYLRAVVHAAQLRPALFGESDRSVLEL